MDYSAYTSLMSRNLNPKSLAIASAANSNLCDGKTAPLARALVLINDAFLHYKHDVFGLPNIFHRIAGYAYNVRQFPRFQGPNLILKT